MKTATIFLALLLLNGFAFSADITLDTGNPADVAMDTVILDAGVNMIRVAVKQDKIRSAVLLIARQGKIILHEAIGWKDKTKGIPIKKDAMFRMASNTKPVVATAISILVEDEKLDYQDYVRQYIKSFDNYRAGSIKIHHLLTHTSGFRIRPIFFRPLVQKSETHPDAPNLLLEVDRFGEVGAEQPVGNTYSYSNAGYNTLGALIEIASGKPLEVFLNERVYTPLGMVDSYHHEVEDKLEGKLDRMSVVYYKRDGQWTEGWKPGDPPQYPFVRASGGMISTATDYAIFCQMFLNGGVYGGKRILNEETVKLMTTPHTFEVYQPDEREQQDAFYGYGWRVARDGVFSHSGSDGTSAFIDPNQQLIVLVFTQSPGERDLARRFLKLAQAAIWE